MQRRQHQMTSLCRLKGDFRGLKVSHLADEDHFRGLPQSSPQGRWKIRCILAYLTLINGGVLVVVKELDWILDSHDMVVFIFINEVDDRSLRRTLAGAGWSCNQHQ